VGGFVGHHQGGEYLYCYAGGNVSGNNNVGGFAGKNDFFYFYNCYAFARVNGKSNQGGFTGYQGGISRYTNSYWASYIKCFWDKTLNNELDGIGNASDPEVIGKSTSDL